MIWEEQFDFAGECLPSIYLWGKDGAFTTIALDRSRNISDVPCLQKHLSRVVEQRNLFFPDEEICCETVWEILQKYEEQLFTASRSLLRISISKDRIELSVREWAFSKEDLQIVPIVLERPYPTVKSLHYEEVLQATKHLDRARTEGILLNQNSQVLEGAFSNLWCFHHNQLILPAGKSLNGITQQTLLEHYDGEVLVREIFWKDLTSFTEVLLVGSGRGVRRATREGTPSQEADALLAFWQKKYQEIFCPTSLRE